MKFCHPPHPTEQDKSPHNVFHPSHSRHVPLPSDDIYELTDGTVARTRGVFGRGRSKGEDPPSMRSGVVSGDRPKHCTRRVKLHVDRSAKTLKPSDRSRKPAARLVKTRISLYLKCTFLNSQCLFLTIRRHFGTKYSLWIFTFCHTGSPEGS